MTARVALTCLAGFVVAVLAQHLLAPELTPDVHTISEYVNADAGPLMVGGFVAWAASMAATARLVRRGARLVAWLLAVAAVGMLLTACFATQTSAGVLPPGIERTTGGRVHDLASGIATLALLGALVTTALRGEWVAWFRGLSRAVLAVAVIASAVLLAIGDPVDGIRQRILVAAACVWQAALVAAAARNRAA